MNGCERKRWTVYADYVRTNAPTKVLAEKHKMSPSTIRTYIKRCKALLDQIGAALVVR